MPTPKVVGDILRPPSSLVELGMRISEITSTKPKTPEQMRVAALKSAADQASAAVSVERQRQRLSKARRDMAKLNQAR